MSGLFIVSDPSFEESVVAIPAPVSLEGASPPEAPTSTATPDHVITHEGQAATEPGVEEAEEPNESASPSVLLRLQPLPSAMEGGQPEDVATSAISSSLEADPTVQAQSAAEPAESQPVKSESRASTAGCTPAASGAVAPRSRKTPTLSLQWLPCRRTGAVASLTFAFGAIIGVAGGLQYGRLTDARIAPALPASASAQPAPAQQAAAPAIAPAATSQATPMISEAVPLPTIAEPEAGLPPQANVESLSNRTPPTSKPQQAREVGVSTTAPNRSAPATTSPGGILAMADDPEPAKAPKAAAATPSSNAKPNLQVAAAGRPEPHASRVRFGWNGIAYLLAGAVVASAKDGNKQIPIGQKLSDGSTLLSVSPQSNSIATDRGVVQFID